MVPKGSSEKLKRTFGTPLYSKEFQGTPRNSKVLQETPRNSEELQRTQRNPRYFANSTRITKLMSPNVFVNKGWLGFVVVR